MEQRCNDVCDSSEVGWWSVEFKFECGIGIDILNYFAIWVHEVIL